MTQLRCLSMVSDCMSETIQTFLALQLVILLSDSLILCVTLPFLRTSKCTKWS